MALWFVFILAVTGVATAVVHLDLIHSPRLQQSIPSYIATIRRRELKGTTQCTVDARWVSINSPNRVGDDGERIRVGFSYVHPDHNTTTLSFDLGVLRLEHDSNNTPALLTFESYAHKTPALVQGFGRLEFNGAVSDTLREGNDTITQNRICNVNCALDGIFKDDMMCIVGVQPCAGDAGGPATVLDYDNRRAVVALQSWNDHECSGEYGGYVRLSAAQDFIKPFFFSLHGFWNDVCMPGYQRPSVE
ncbi:hypothetical protein AC1031_004438 [Aphanomyces cochlioides]|nr:hypothetical protein AC1031_004438 [Aphanomyces cochlioides]